ncbi:MAG: hypothetical protein M1832_001543 [Thelocarpon impressellum]|nr:MAG: hypothetical protein M1832_001543 [Thelocarpon impressellum]
MSGTNLGPVPARLVFLSELHKAAVGDKVRFLGCVMRYSIEDATLVLRHQYPVQSSSAALVNIFILLDTVSASDLQVGEWLNVIGYVSISSTDAALKNERPATSPRVYVQAIAVWTAGAIKLGEYEKVLEERREVERRLMTRWPARLQIEERSLAQLERSA